MADSEKKDLFFRLKYMGYCLANLPPKVEDWTYLDLIRTAKFHLARKWAKSVKDKLFENYRDEEILVEYYAHKVVDDPEFAEIIKNKVLGIENFNDVEDLSQAFETEIEKNKAAVEAYKQKLLKEQSDNIEEDEEFSFKPGEES